MTKVTAQMLAEWDALAGILPRGQPPINTGFYRSKARVYHRIAEMYGVDVATVYRYMSGRLRKQRTNRAYRLTAGAKIGDYDLRYKHLIRHLDTVLPQLYNGNSDLPLSRLTVRIGELTGIQMQEETLEKLLAGYQGKPRGPPLLRTESGSYKLNPSYYASSQNAPVYQESGVSREDQRQPV